MSRRTRVVLVIDRRAAFDDYPRALAAALDRIASLGYEMVGVMDPSDHRRAHGLIADDKADVLVVLRREDLPSVAALPWDDDAGRTARTHRPEVLLRPSPDLRSVPEQRSGRRTERLPQADAERPTTRRPRFRESA